MSSVKSKLSKCLSRHHPNLPPRGMMWQGMMMCVWVLRAKGGFLTVCSTRWDTRTHSSLFGVWHTNDFKSPIKGSLMWCDVANKQEGGSAMIRVRFSASTTLISYFGKEGGGRGVLFINAVTTWWITCIFGLCFGICLFIFALLLVYFGPLKKKKKTWSQEKYISIIPSGISI